MFKQVITFDRESLTPGDIVRIQRVDGGAPAINPPPFDIQGVVHDVKPDTIKVAYVSNGVLKHAEYPIRMFIPTTERTELVLYELVNPTWERQNPNPYPVEPPVTEEPPTDPPVTEEPTP